MKHFWITILLSLPAFADVLVEEFTTAMQKESSTAVWNFALGKVHPSLRIENFQEGATPGTPYDLDVGDGSHGAFNATTYSQFGTVVGNYITIDAALFPVLKVSTFHLAAGYTLTSINGPLVIYSLSDVLIEGLIECNGFAGNPAAGAAGGAGGAGRCGGRNGGSGGNATTSGTQGLPLAGLVTGGGGGNYIGVAPGSGGGGGGGYAGATGSNGQNSNPATNTFGSGGGGGPAGQDLDFTFVLGSPGGGGGSGSNTEGGGGGGGGGGMVVIHAVRNFVISLTGSINATGGNGGTANTGGGGGGGGGGSVKIFSPNPLELQPNALVVDVTEGTGGNATNVNSGDGGAGSSGRTWLIPFFGIIGPGFESHPSLLTTTGDVLYTLSSQNIVSKSYDTQSTLVKYSSFAATPTMAGLTLEISGSSDNFSSDNSGWLPLSSISQIDKKRYVKFKVTIANTNATAPLTIDSLSLNYDSGLQEEFTFKGCGHIGSPPPPPSNSNRIAILLLLLLPVFVANRLKLLKAK